MHRSLWVAALFAAASGSDRVSAQELRFADVFQTHAVLQREIAIPVWGTARPGSRIAISLGGQTTEVTANTTGNWRADLPALPAGGPYTLVARDLSGTAVNLTDIMVGDVYLCGGQSNMAFPLRASINGKAEGDKPSDPSIRLLNIPKSGAASPQPRLPANARWVVSGPDSAPDFSAVCLLTARNLKPSVNATIGLIESAFGGSPIEEWLERDSLSNTGIADVPVKLHDMYVSDMDGARRAYGETVESWWKSRKIPEDLAWRAPELDDADWKQVHLQGKWQDAAIPELMAFNGTLWLRQHVVIKPEQAGRPATLNLGILNDIDAAFVNGTWIGAEDGDAVRHYPIKAGLLHAGDNLVAIRLNGTYGNGAFKPSDISPSLAVGSDIVTMSTDWRYRILADSTKSGTPPRAPWSSGHGYTNLYNAMIAPLTPYAIKAVIWYQGEQNASAAKPYMRFLPALMKNWRDRFGAATPFYIIQLPNWHPHAARPTESNWAELREAQRRSVENDIQSRLVTTIDLGDIADVHPVNKRDVASRLALQIRQLSYKEKIVASGPNPVAATRSATEVVVSYRDTGSGLVAYGNSRPVGFELCNGPKSCSFVDASIEGTSVKLKIPDGFEPTKVRYAWADSPIVNLYNQEGLPAVPFELEVR